MTTHLLARFALFAVIAIGSGLLLSGLRLFGNSGSKHKHMRLLTLCLAVTTVFSSFAHAGHQPLLYAANTYYLAPKTTPVSQPCFSYGQLVTSDEISSLGTAAFCADIRPLWIEGKIPKSNYYELAGNQQISSPIYGCNIDAKTYQIRFPAVCKATSVAPQGAVYGFPSYDYSGSTQRASLFRHSHTFRCVGMTPPVKPAHSSRSLSGISGI